MAISGTAMAVEPSGQILGATVRGVDLSASVSDAEFAAILLALGRHGVLRFPAQRLEAENLRDFSQRFGRIRGPEEAVDLCVPRSRTTRSPISEAGAIRRSSTCFWISLRASDGLGVRSSSSNWSRASTQPLSGFRCGRHRLEW